MVKKLLCGVGAAALLVPATTLPATAGGEGGRGCERALDSAIQAYVDTTDARDAEGFADLLHPEVTAIFADGEVLLGRDATMAFIGPFFAAPGWTQTFDEVARQVEGCSTGFVLFDSVYTQGDTVVPVVIGLTFTRVDGEWLVLHNQDSSGPAVIG